MNRAEFIEKHRNMSEEEMIAQVTVARTRAQSRVSDEMKKLFRSLDDCTSAEELYIQTAATDKLGRKTHVYRVWSNNLTENAPVMINIHGGGWSLEHTERDVYFSRRIAARMNCLVVDIDYVLAPEYPYPAALEEIEALYDKLHELIPAWGGSLDNIVICGQSAGGNLTAAVNQRKKYKPFPGLKAQILCYSPCDNYNDHFHGEELDPRGESTEYYGFYYNRIFEERKNSDVSLVYAAEEDLQGLPATDIIIAGIDNLVEEQQTYYDLLKKHGIPVTCKLYPDSMHGFVVNLYGDWKDGEIYIADLLKKHWEE